MCHLYSRDWGVKGNKTNILTSLQEISFSWGKWIKTNTEIIIQLMMYIIKEMNKDLR